MPCLIGWQAIATVKVVLQELPAVERWAKRDKVKTKNISLIVMFRTNPSTADFREPTRNTKSQMPSYSNLMQ